MKHIHTYTDGADCRQSKIETSTLQPMQKKNKTTTFRRRRFIQLWHATTIYTDPSN